MLKKIISFFIGQTTGYVSQVDHFLAKIRQEHPQPSPSQIQEMQRHQEIAQKRDGTTEETLFTTGH